MLSYFINKSHRHSDDYLYVKKNYKHIEIEPICCFQPKHEKQAVMDVAYCNLLKGSKAKVGFVDVAMVQ